MQKTIKLVETRLKKNIDIPIYEINNSDELIEMTAAQVLSRKTDSAAFVYLDSKNKIVNMQLATIKTLEKHKEEIIAMAISHNAAGVLVTSNIRYERGNLRAVQFMQDWQQAFNNNNFTVLEHLQTWLDETGTMQTYSFADNELIRRNNNNKVSSMANNDVTFSKSGFFTSKLELKETGELLLRGEGGLEMPSLL